MANDFKWLASQYVLLDSAERHQTIAAEAASAIRDAPNNRVAVGQWVSSINPWMLSQNQQASQDLPPGDEKDDIINRAKALEFLADTLAALGEDTLKFDQVKLLVVFFGSLFSTDHRGGIGASTKALRQLASMKSFRPSLGNIIISSIANLGDDFKLQTTSTRLEIYDLILTLLRDPSVASELVKGEETYGFMRSLLDLCRNERDPQNLLKWFETLRVFLQNFSPDKAVATEIFKAFSGYFPITLRASATPSGITADDLKGALRSCFSAHHCIADLTIPFLINKLDQGEAVTVAVKVDILQTLEACLAQYQDASVGVAPFADTIWASLKYEVRNGEIRDAISATLQTIRALVRRLEGEDLARFFSSAWTDLADDVADKSHTGQAGLLLMSIAGATQQSFSLSTPRILNHVKGTLRQASSANHRLELLSMLNSLLTLRLNFDNVNPEEDLQDELFGDSLYNEVYSPAWTENPAGLFLPDETDMFKKIMDGMASLVLQRSHAGTTPGQLCSENVCLQIFDRLGAQGIVAPLEEHAHGEGTVSHQRELDISDAAAKALERISPRHPQGFRHLLRQYLSSLTKVAQIPGYSYVRLIDATQRLVSIGCTQPPTEPQSPISNSVYTINTLLDGLHEVLKAHPSLWYATICAIHVAILSSADALKLKMPQKDAKGQPVLPTDVAARNVNWVKPLESGLPRIDLDKPEDPEATRQTLDKLEKDIPAAYEQFLAYGVFVLTQLYRRFTAVKIDPKLGTHDVGLSADFAAGADPSALQFQDQSLYALGRLAVLVISPLSLMDQLDLKLEMQAFLMFRGTDPVAGGDRATEPGGGEPDGGEPDRDFATAKKEQPRLLFSHLDGYRTTPLAMGIMQGVRPKALFAVYNEQSFLSLCETLCQPSPCSGMARVSLDSLLAILSNKFDTNNPLPKSDWTQVYFAAAAGYRSVMSRSQRGGLDDATCLAIFKSVLHFLAGDVARFRPDTPILPGMERGDETQDNWLLYLVRDTAPQEPTMGRQLAQCFEILVSPKDYFSVGHPVLKRLREQWIYVRVVQPQLAMCVTPHVPDPRVQTNRSIAVFAILKHLKYQSYEADVKMITRVVIRALTAFKISQDLVAALDILHEILENEPTELTEHLTTLVPRTLEVCEMARSVSEAFRISGSVTAGKGKSSNGEAIACRMSILRFLHNLPKSFEERHLLPFVQVVLRGLSSACGDPVREVRQVALIARRGWHSLSGTGS